MHTKPLSGIAPLHRCRPLRIEQPAALWFVTTRTIEERFWLHPILSCGLDSGNRAVRQTSKRLERLYHRRVVALVQSANARMGPHQPRLTIELAKRLLKGAVGSALARAQAHCRDHGLDVDIFAFVAMSNHVHMVVRTHGKNLAAFMGYFKARVTESINYLSGRRGPLFSRRYDAQRILNSRAASGRVAYTIDNPRRAQAVDHHAHWPGLLLCYGLQRSDHPRFEFLARTSWHKARRPEGIHCFIETATLVLTPLPHLTHIERDEYRRMVDDWIGKLERDASHDQRGDKPRVQHSHDNGPRGIAAILNTPFEHRPAQAARRRRPYAFGTPHELADYYEACSVITAIHRDASVEFRTRDRNARFPEGTYPPPIVVAS